MAAAFASAVAAAAARAVTPKGTVVIAWQLDGVITFDPGESYEIATQEFGTNDGDGRPNFIWGSCYEKYQPTGDAIEPHKRWRAGIFQFESRSILF
jgi:hypothetical protein